MTDYIKGIIGGLIFGIIATIPWVLLYVFGDMMLSLLAIIIAIAVLKGYKLFKGKVDNKLPVIIIIISLVSITIATFIIIPIGLLFKEDIPVNYDNFMLLYNYDKFADGIIRDYIISVIFTFLGISGVVSSVKKQLSE